jgi:hypothetical protein
VDTEARWRVVWGAWVVAFAVAETIALRGKHPHAPLSHHARTALRASESKAGSIVIAGGAAWLINHLFRQGSSPSG